jgi:hypothetical protein
MYCLVHNIEKILTRLIHEELGRPFSQAFFEAEMSTS